MFSKALSRIDFYSEKRKKVYIVPTKLGLKFVGCNFFIFLMALSYSNNMALIVAFIMVSYLIINMLETHKIIQETKITQAQIKSFFLSHPACLNIGFEKEISPEASRLLEIKLQRYDGENLIELATDKGCEKTESSNRFRLLNIKRGHYRFNSLKLYTYGHSGLFYVWRYFPIHTDFYIYPAKKFTAQLKQGLSEQKQIDYSESEFKFHIPYQNGMSSKRIDWKVFARTDSLYWKKHIDHGQEAIEINYFSLPGEHEEKLEYMAYLIDKHFKEGNSWKLVLPQKVLNFSKGGYHHQYSLEQISVL